MTFYIALERIIKKIFRYQKGKLKQLKADYGAKAIQSLMYNKTMCNVKWSTYVHNVKQWHHSVIRTFLMLQSLTIIQYEMESSCITKDVNNRH